MSATARHHEGEGSTNAEDGTSTVYCSYQFVRYIEVIYG
ncbi:hypothetical protein L914_01615 [Phytophthora nicotianae]|uniref:Uncharacterized protein n=1 Tax=Phytophthora nicotianae TaxID=4792 RepID=W2P4F5_PHYNI|nr:hypothetical protein L914_01615 [Phytophthora nicotianae]